MARDVDVIVVGGGHNGLVAGFYLSRSGLRTLVLERRGGLPIHIASVVHPGVVSELAELLTPHL